MYNSPCYLCKDKKESCHSSCGKYQSFRKNLDELNDKNNKEKEINNQVNSYVIRNIQKYYKKHNLKK